MSGNEQLLGLLKQSPVAAYALAQQATSSNTPEQRISFLSGFTSFICANIPPPQLSQYLTALAFGPDFSAIIDKISEGASASICGRVFDEGDTAYSCTDCQADEYCCVCSDCFTKGNHVGHNVRAFIASSGGTCDCGDPDAWNSKGFCSKHTGANEQDDPTKTIPDDLRTSLTGVSAALLEMAARMLSGHQNCHLYPATLLKGDASKLAGPFAVLLHNDDEHSYDDVIGILKEAVPGATDAQGHFFALRVDLIGQTVVRLGTEAECDASIAKLTLIGLKATKTTNATCFFDTTATCILEWLETIGAEHDGLNRLIGASASRDCSLTPDKPQPILAHLVKSTMTLVRDLHFKKHFSVHFIESYDSILTAVARNAISFEESLLQFSVQLLTSAPLCLPLLSSGLLETVLGSLHRVCELKHEIENIPLGVKDDKFWPDGPLLTDGTFIYAFNNIEHILSLPPVAEAMAANPATFELWLKYFVRTQVRKTDVHVQMETQSWANALNLCISPYKTIPLVFSAISAQAKRGNALSLRNATGAVLGSLLTWLATPEAQIQFAEPPNQTIVSTKVLTSSTSIHTALQRLMTECLLCLAPLCASPQDFKSRVSAFIETRSFAGAPLDLDRFAALVMEHPLRTFVFVSQASCGLWVRNGYQVIGQVLNYRRLFSRSFFERDLATIQIAAALLPSAHFVSTLLQKFDLESFLVGPLVPTTTEQVTIVNTTVEDLLLLIISVLSDRVNTGHTSVESQVDQEVIQRAWLGRTTASKLKKALPRGFADEAVFDHAIKKYCRIIKATGSEQGGLDLKPEAKELFDPFFIHYTREEREKALELYREHRSRQLKDSKKADSDPTAHRPPKPLAPLQPALSSIQSLLGEPLLHELVGRILQRSLRIDLSQFTTPTQVLMCLHLIQLALQQENLGPAFFSLLTPRDDSNLLKTVQKLAETNIAAGWILKELAARGSDEIKTALVAAQPAPEHALAVSPGTPTSSEDADARKKRQAEARAKALADMAKRQQAFAAKFKDELAATSPTADAAQQPTEKPHSHTIDETCVVCMEQCVNPLERAWGFIGFGNRSAVPTLTNINPSHRAQAFKPENELKDLMVQSHQLKTCGHTIHFDCYDKYLTTSTANQENILDNGLLVNRAVGEFVCPLCKAISNVLIPSTPHLFDGNRHLISSQEGSTLPTTPAAIFDAILTHATNKTTWWTAGAAQAASATPVETQGFNFKSSLEAFVDRLACLSDNSDTPEITAPGGLTHYLDEFLTGSIQTLEIEQRGSALPSSRMARELQLLRLLISATLQYQQHCRRPAQTPSPASNVALLLADPNFHTEDESNGIFTLSPVLAQDIFSLFAHCLTSKLPFTRNQASVDSDDFRILAAACLLAQYVQAIVYAQVSPLEALPGDSDDSELLDLARQISDEANKIPRPDQVVQEAKFDLPIANSCAIRHCHVLLKRMALLHAALAGVDAPVLPEDSRSVLSQCQNLLHFIGIQSDLGSVLRAPTALTLASRMCEQLKLFPFTPLAEYKPLGTISWQHIPWHQRLRGLVLQFPRPFELFAFPTSFHTLLQSFHGQTCPQCKSPASLAVELITGTTVCARCPRQIDLKLGGPCTKLSWAVNVGSGIFFLVNAVIVIGLKDGYGYLLPSFYLDAFGEEDPGMRRGKPLLLDQERMQVLHAMLLRGTVGVTNAKLLRAGKNEY